MQYRAASLHRWFALWCILVAAVLPAQSASRPASAGPPTVAIANVTIVDVDGGRQLRDHTVLVQGRRITAVGPNASVRVPTGSRIVDGRSRYLIPGLWDMHVHTAGPRSEELLPVYVAHGVTGVRDMGTDLEVLRARRDLVRNGSAIGPRIVMAGPILDGPLGAPMPVSHRRWRIEVTDTARARRLVDSIAGAGADFIKVHERLAPPVYHAIIAAARRRRLPVAGHIPTLVGPEAAAAAGQRSVEHLVNVPLTCTPAEAEALRPRSPLETLFGRCATGFEALARRFAQSGTWHTPTLVVQRRIALGLGATPGDPGLRHVPAPVRAMLREVMPLDGPAPPPDVRHRLRRLFDKRAAQAGSLQRAGVGLLVGTDAPGVAPGWSVHEELRLLVSAGLSTRDALRAATTDPARYLNATDSLGAIATGKLADLVLLDADPLADIGNTQKIAAVIVNGRVLERAALDRLLAEAARAAAAGSQALR